MSSNVKQHAKFLRWAAWALCAVPIGLLAAEKPAGRPERPAANGAGPDRAIERDRGDGARTGIGGHPRVPLSDEEWRVTEKFLEAHAPNRLKFVQNISESQHKENLKRVLFGLVRNINALQVESESIYKLRIQEFELDDQIFAICRDLRSAPAAQKQKLQADLRAKITLLFDKGLDERKDRIERLQKMIEDQKKALDKDRDTRDDIIKKRFIFIAKNGVDGARLNPKIETILTPESSTAPASSPGEGSPEQ